MSHNAFKMKCQFIQNVVIMYDALEELSDLSLALQKSDITLPVAHKLVNGQIKIFVISCAAKF